MVDYIKSGLENCTISLIMAMMVQTQENLDTHCMQVYTVNHDIEQRGNHCEVLFKVLAIIGPEGCV